MPVVTRTITPEDVEPWVRAAALGFLDPRDDTFAADAEFRRSRGLLDYARTYGAFDGDRCVGTFRSFATDLTLPGNTTLTVSGITAVTVSPSHRRRGILSEMMRKDLRASLDRGEPAAVLIASEWPIYGRFGFGATTEAVTYEFDKTRANLSPDGGLPAYTFEHVSPAALVTIAPPIFERHRLRRPGSIDRNRPSWWTINFGVEIPPGYSHSWKGFAVVACDPAGAPAGYLRYHVDDRWDDRVCQSALVIDELTAATDEATRELWRFAAGVDLTVKVRAEQRPVDEWLGWELADGRAFRQLSRADLLWLRPLDVPRLLEARGYFVSDRLVIEVEDDELLSSPRFELDATPDGVRCRPAKASADVALDAAALGSIVLGGHSPVTMAAARRLSEHTPGAVERAARLFWSPVAPWCNTWF